MSTATDASPAACAAGDSAVRCSAMPTATDVTTEHPRVSQASTNHVLRSTARILSTTTLSTTTGIWSFPGPVPRPDLQCYYCCNASVVYEFHGQRQQLPQSMTRHVGPAVPARSWPHDYLQTYLLLASSRTRQNAHSRFIDVYQHHTYLLSTRSETCSTFLHSAQAAAGASAEVQATHARPAQTHTYDARTMYTFDTGRVSRSPRVGLHSRFRSRSRRRGQINGQTSRENTHFESLHV